MNSKIIHVSLIYRENNKRRARLNKPFLFVFFQCQQVQRPSAIEQPYLKNIVDSCQIFCQRRGRTVFSVNKSCELE